MTSQAQASSAPIENEKARAGVAILYAAIAIGFLSDALLRATPWGLNLFLWTTTVVVTFVSLNRWIQPNTRSSELRFLIPAVLFSAASAWRDSPTLKSLDVFAILILFALALWSRQGGVVLSGFLTGYFKAAVRLVAESLSGLLTTLVHAVNWKQIPTRHWLTQIGPILLGLALSFPVVVVFGVLFSSADLHFNNLMVSIIKPEALVLHLITICAGTWLAGGYLKGMLIQDRPDRPPVAQEIKIFNLGHIEIGVVLTSLNLLFFAFVAIQIPYFFGGDAQIEITPGLLRSEYARRGFFELVSVAAILLPILLFADWLLRDSHQKQFFRLAATSLVIMLFVIMASALQRMWIYQREFGLTELRLYTTAFMVWLALTAAWFLFTVIPGARQRFAFGSLVAGLALIAVLHVVNPDALIVKTNAARISSVQEFDAAYATGLSDDAIPALVSILPSLPATSQQLIIERLYALEEEEDWRTWSLSTSLARRAIREGK